MPLGSIWFLKLMMRSSAPGVSAEAAPNDIAATFARTLIYVRHVLGLKTTGIPSDFSLKSSADSLCEEITKK